MKRLAVLGTAVIALTFPVNTTAVPIPKPDPQTNARLVELLNSNIGLLRQILSGKRCCVQVPD